MLGPRRYFLYAAEGLAPRKRAGQPENIACVESSIHAVEMAANPKYDPDSAAEYGEWGVKKVYIHLGAHPTITMDWTRPLTAFDGKSGLEVAETAFQCHESQAGLSREIAYPGTEYDSSLYTLLRSTVGIDIKCDDFFENIPEDLHCNDLGGTEK